jgi:hypothetical protein
MIGAICSNEVAEKDTERLCSPVGGLISAKRAIEMEARFPLFELMGTRVEPGPHR